MPGCALLSYAGIKLVSELETLNLYLAEGKTKTRTKWRP